MDKIMPLIEARTTTIMVSLLLLFFLIFSCGCLSFGTTSPPPGLTDPEWHLTSYRSHDGTQTQVIPNTSITLKFSPDGQFSGNAGCNHYSGSYSVEGELITLESLTSTEMYCSQPGGVMPQESEYLRLLKNATRFSIPNEYLVLSRYDIEKLLVFTGK